MLPEPGPSLPSETEHAATAVVEGPDDGQGRGRQADVLEGSEEKGLVNGGEGRGEVEEKIAGSSVMAYSAAASFTSTTLAKMDRPRRNPHCSGPTHAAKVGSHL